MLLESLNIPLTQVPQLWKTTGTQTLREGVVLMFCHLQNRLSSIFGMKPAHLGECTHSMTRYCTRYRGFSLISLSDGFILAS